MTQRDPSRLTEVIDERVFNFAQGAQRHYKTNDLVVILDLQEADPAFNAVPRQALAGLEGLSPDAKLKF